jgi:TPR repeat protein
MKLKIFFFITLVAVLVNGCGQESSSERSLNDLDEFDRASVKAARGDASSQYQLGNMYYTGQRITRDYVDQRVPPDYDKAMEWLRKAAEQGFPHAQSGLGMLYDNGQGTSQDYAEAAKWYRKAADQGDFDGQVNLGVMYHDGRGVQRDYVEAAEWFRKAAERGDSTAQCDLGLCYRDGHGVPQNYVEAYKWYNLAAVQNEGNTKATPYNVLDVRDNALATRQREALSLRMTSAQIAEAQQLSREFVPH